MTLGRRKKRMSFSRHAITATMLLAALPAAVPVQAASSDWYETEGGRIRLVTTGAPSPEGTLRAALQVDVAPGWKTYWRDPGDAGVPPQVTFPADSGVRDVSIGFPVPKRFDEGSAAWTGYEWPVSLALTLHLSPGETPRALEADVFLGLCETICIPVQTKLTLDPARKADDIFDRSVVNAAFDSLPAKASPAFGVTSARRQGDTLAVETTAKNTETLDLFLAGSGGYQFGEPVRAPDNKSFTARILTEPKSATAPTTILYTLSAGETAVQGQFTLP